MHVCIFEFERQQRQFGYKQYAHNHRKYGKDDGIGNVIGIKRVVVLMNEREWSDKDGIGRCGQYDKFLGMAGIYIKFW